MSYYNELFLPVLGLREAIYLFLILVMMEIFYEIFLKKKFCFVLSFVDSLAIVTGQGKSPSRLDLLNSNIIQ